ncbi:hypothetical protein [Desulfovirgula thermocuniculi]|uniref:hypothetical protein n=1 Tax=Desulfovirgula thermocuniculi TaxID=348842 RepID=UPI0003FDA3E6|nr:hypothetical protein [Desulfovirgula thermocuniculi]
MAELTYEEVSALLARLGIAGRADPAVGKVLLPGRGELERLASFFDCYLHPLAVGFEACGWEFTLRLEKGGEAA